MMRTKTASSPATKVGTPKALWLTTPGFVSLTELVERPPARDLLEDAIRVDALGREHRRQGAFVTQVAALVVAEGEQGHVGAEELLGEPVPHDDPDLAGEQVRLFAQGRPRPVCPPLRRGPG